MYPQYYTDPKILQDKIDEYFDEYTGMTYVKDELGNVMHNDKGHPLVNLKPPTIAGLAYYLGFADRQSIYDYIKRNDGLSCIIKRALLRIEQFAESQLHTNKPVGAIFWLKNHKWIDKREHDVNVKTFADYLRERDNQGDDAAL